MSACFTAFRPITPAGFPPFFNIHDFKRIVITILHKVPAIFLRVCLIFDTIISERLRCLPSKNYVVGKGALYLFPPHSF
jgi:hypothetical protein